MDISKLLVLQNKIDYNSDEFQGMVDFVRKGGFFTLEAMESFRTTTNTAWLARNGKPKIMTITQFEDGKKYTHDGHHRACAILLGGRPQLAKSEYRLIRMRYEQYDEINPAMTYVTPFLPDKELRLSDFGDFKNHVMDLFTQGREDDAILFVKQNKHLYATKRDIWTIEDLIRRSQR